MPGGTSSGSLGLRDASGPEQLFLYQRGKLTFLCVMLNAKRASPRHSQAFPGCTGVIFSVMGGAGFLPLEDTGASGVEVEREKGIITRQLI